MNWGLFASTFTLIFVAELPDKTAFTTLLLSTCYQPLAVFCGASIAFTIQSVVAVAFGSVFSLIPQQIVHLVAGILFIVFAILMWRRKQDSVSGLNCDRSTAPTFLRSVTSSFMMIFAAEWGDLTQLATATLSAHTRSPITIFVAATLALWTVTLIGVIVGSRVKHLIHPKALQITASVAMAIAGVILLAQV